MNVVERCAGVGMTELLFCDFWRVARVHDDGRNGVPESMKTASRNIEHVEDWPKPVFHDVVARRRPVVSGSKQPTLWVSGPDRVVLPQNVCEHIRQSHRRRTRLALCGLSFSVPRRAADVNAFVRQSLFTLVHAQIALTNSLLQYVLTCVVEPPDEVLPAARARAKARYAKILRLAGQEVATRNQATLEQVLEHSKQQ